MSHESPAAPAGWYPDPFGVTRYWDGTQWLDIPPPAQTAHAETAKPPSRRRRNIWVAAVALAAALLIAGGAVAVTTKVQSDQAEAARLSKAEADAKAEKQAAAEAEAERDRKAGADRRERASRENAVTEIEASVKTMAETHVTDGLLEGTILEVTCSPVNGGSMDDLGQRTTVFQCFVANEDNGDGTMSGYYYNATMNWDTQEYSYGFGEP
ncbi:hypothetical protein CW368_07690 [Actinomycetales bacterium SN12]|nr:hypothetical protein CW368_07690 [Actinomycetales bacterium SN12]